MKEGRKEGRNEIKKVVLVYVYIVFSNMYIKLVFNILMEFEYIYEFEPQPEREIEPYWSNYLQQFADLDSSYFQNIPKDTDKFCVIIEPREHPLLIPVIKNFMYLLQTKNWGLIIFHGTTNKDFLLHHLKDWSNVNYVNLNTNNLSTVEYNDFCCSSYFWDTLASFGCNHALSFETDALLLKDNADEFIQYDYIGAPWIETPWKDPPFYVQLQIGNSGLSLRNVEKMLEIIHTCARGDLRNNDVYFGYWCLMKNYNIPRVDVAMQFSIETIYSTDSMGMHKPQLHNFPDYESYISLLNKKHVK